MHPSQMTQLLVLAECIVLGGVFGVLYDILRAARRAFYLKGVGTAVCDFIFCSCFLFGLFQFSITLGLGENRAFTLVGIVIGWGIYWMMAGKLVLKMSMTVLRFLYQVISGIAHFVKKCIISAQKVAYRIYGEKKLPLLKKNTSIFKRKGLK